MPELTAVKVKIGRHASGRAAYPAFNGLAIVQASGMDWSHYIDAEGLGWQYDRTSGHDDETPDSPRGQQWGLLVVPEQFAIEAVEQFPRDCERLNEADCESFMNQKVLLDEEATITDREALEECERELRLLKELQGSPEEPADIASRMTSVRQKIVDATNPNSRKRGVRANPRRNWAAIKSDQSITYRDGGR